MLTKNAPLYGKFVFTTSPSNVLQNNFVDLSQLFSRIQQYYQYYSILREHEELIRSCNNTVIDDFKDIVDGLVHVVHNNLFDIHELHFDAKDSSSDILKKLNEGIIDTKSIASFEKSLI